jgi:hypothetical protein
MFVMREMAQHKNIRLPEITMIHLQLEICIVIEPEMLDISIPAGAVFRRPLPRGHTAFAYVL